MQATVASNETSEPQAQGEMMMTTTQTINDLSSLVEQIELTLKHAGKLADRQAYAVNVISKASCQHQEGGVKIKSQDLLLALKQYAPDYSLWVPKRESLSAPYRIVSSHQPAGYPESVRFA